MVKVSIVAAIYNAECYLEEMIKSVLKQTYQEWELILVNDGSVDSSKKICEIYAEKNKNIKVISIPNGGPGNARNIGMREAKGKYVYFIDADDTIEQLEIEKIVELAEKNNADTVLGGYKRVDEHNQLRQIIDYEYTVYENKAVLTECLPRIIGSKPEKSDSYKVMVWNTLYSKKIIDCFHIRFNEQKDLKAEDTIFNIDYFAKANKVIISENVGYLYRCNSQSLTSLKFDELLFEKIKYSYRIQEKKLRENKIYEISKWRLERQLFVDLRECFIRLMPNISQKGKKEILECMDKILKDDFVRYAIKDYPINRTQLSQKIFLYFVKYRLKTMLFYSMKIYTRKRKI